MSYYWPGGLGEGGSRPPKPNPYDGDGGASFDPREVPDHEIGWDRKKYAGEDPPEGKFVVHTPALEHFADQVERLRKPLTEAFDELNACLPLAAGRFKIADQISDDGNSLRETYLRGIATMRDGLQDIEDRVREDAEIFKELEEANTGVVTDEAP